ncbi:hypothetical protein JTB14_023453 [Gonioctena quinquepunctata]|nr:hypothetical protein JTB14_023453 [Gonioctena quinquepunctata]
MPDWKQCHLTSGTGDDFPTTLQKRNFAGPQMLLRWRTGFQELTRGLLLVKQPPRKFSTTDFSYHAEHAFPMVEAASAVAMRTCIGQERTYGQIET